ncbi:MAG: hypothetical protein AAGC55_13760, partial [Myxococcota bacterium]
MAENPELHIMFSPTGGTGKVRLLQWAFEHTYSIHGLRAPDGNEGGTEPIVRLGSRRMPSGGTLPSVSELDWTKGERKIDIFRFAYDASFKADIMEAHKVLDRLGYYYYPAGSGEPVPPANATDADRQDLAKLPDRLLRFQMINDLPLTSQLDNDTLNRMFNLDHARQNLARAKAFDAGAVVAPTIAITQRSGYFPLKNADAEIPHTPVQTYSGTDPQYDTADKQYNRYPYYIAGTAASVTAPPGTVDATVGWLADNRPIFDVPGKQDGATAWVSAERVDGFVGMHSRRLLPESAGTDNREAYDYVTLDNNRWRLSEGEAASGRYFLSARSTQPWVPGRWQVPPAAPDSLFGPHTTPVNGKISQIYQWVDIKPLVDARNDLSPQPELYLIASVLQRALFRENKLVDQGRIRIELYSSAEYDAAVRPDFSGGGYPEYAQSEWFPSQEITTAALYLSNSARKRNWVYRDTPALLAPAGVSTDPATKTKALVILEGKLNGGHDCDAYFDDVRLRWELREPTTP